MLIPFFFAELALDRSFETKHERAGVPAVMPGEEGARIALGPARASKGTGKERENKERTFEIWE